LGRRPVRGSDVLGGGRLGLVGICDSDRRDEPAVLGPGMGRPPGRAAQEHPLDVVVHRGGHRLQPPVAADVEDPAVQSAVQLRQGGEVASLGCDPGPVEQFGEGRDVVRCRPLGGEPGRQRLQSAADREQVRDQAGVLIGDDRAAAGGDGHEPLGGDDPQRLADRVAGDAEVGGQPVLGQALTDRVPAGDDPPAQGFQDGVAQHDVVVADGRPRLRRLADGRPRLAGPADRRCHRASPRPSNPFRER